MNRKKKTMQLADTKTVLGFLQAHYTTFLNHPSEIREEITSKNKQIQKELNAETSLRELYIDLLLHDQLITNSKQIKPQKVSSDHLKKQIKTIIQGKIMIQHNIKIRETRGEIIIPNAEVLTLLSSCNQDFETLREGVLKWTLHPQEFKARLDIEIQALEEEHKYSDEKELTTGTFVTEESPGILPMEGPSETLMTKLIKCLVECANQDWSRNENKQKIASLRNFICILEVAELFLKEVNDVSK